MFGIIFPVFALDSVFVNEDLIGPSRVCEPAEATLGFFVEQHSEMGRKLIRNFKICLPSSSRNVC